MSTRNFQPGDAYGIAFTVKSATGALVAADVLPVGTLYHNGVADGAVVVTITAGATGVYEASATIPGGYAAGDRVSLLVTATIGGVATGEFVDQLRLVGWPNTALPAAAAGATGGVPVLDASGNVPADAKVWSAGNVPADLKAWNGGALPTPAAGNVPAEVNAYGAGQDPATLMSAAGYTAARAAGLDGLVAFLGSYVTGTVSAVANAFIFTVAFDAAVVAGDLPGCICCIAGTDRRPGKGPILVASQVDPTHVTLQFNASTWAAAPLVGDRVVVI